MKKSLLILLISLGGFTFKDKDPKEDEIIYIDSNDIEWSPIDSVIDKNHILKYHLGKLESNNNYNVINSFGYLGKYQFGRSTLKALGYSDESIEMFLYSPRMQEEAMERLLLSNRRTLRRYGLHKFVGNRIKGYNITMEGLLAGAHLVGPKSVYRYIRSGGRYEKRDGFGTSVEKYISYFERPSEIYKNDFFSFCNSLDNSNI